MKIVWLAGTLLLVAWFANTAAAQATSLSPAESTIIEKQIAALPSPEERQLARAWSDAKRVAEMLCRPSAMPVLRRQVPGTDRFFLGTDAPDSLTLESNRRLIGSGSLRSPGGWRDFTFECRLNPRTGRVTKFAATVKP